MSRYLYILILTLVSGTNFLLSAERRENTPPPPGVVIQASVDWENQKDCVSSPSLVVMPDGTYIATNDCFHMTPTTVHESKDQGATWTKIAEIENHNSGTLFRIGTTLYLIGYYHPQVPGKDYSWIGLRKSEDGGHTWTDPGTDPHSGVLLSDDVYFSDAVPVLIHNGRVWWQVDVVRGGNEMWLFGVGNNAAMVISAPIDCNLLDADNWTRSNVVESKTDETAWGWIEGNVLADPNGEMFVYMRMEQPDDKTHCIAKLRLSQDGKELAFDINKDLIPFPSRRAKFNIRYDEVSNKYWSLTSWGTNGPRNRLLLVCSEDMVDWDIRATIYKDEEYPQNGFQYVDWRVDGDDLVLAMRLGWHGRNFHDANYIVFDRIKDFRNRTDAE
ncbi:MAG: sialidase family protein [Planctomycetia bacterium]|nr:sialidase family protein [Planctomycetia bacterium]